MLHLESSFLNNFTDLNSTQISTSAYQLNYILALQMLSVSTPLVLTSAVALQEHRETGNPVAMLMNAAWVHIIAVRMHSAKILLVLMTAVVSKDSRVME